MERQLIAPQHETMGPPSREAEPTGRRHRVCIDGWLFALIGRVEWSFGWVDGEGQSFCAGCSGKCQDEKANWADELELGSWGFHMVEDACPEKRYGIAMLGSRIERGADADREDGGCCFVSWFKAGRVGGVGGGVCVQGPLIGIVYATLPTLVLDFLSVSTFEIAHGHHQFGNDFFLSPMLQLAHEVEN